jgi:hypothetical protein
MERRAGVDGRTAALRLTRRGQRLADKGRRIRERICGQVVNGLSASERQTLGELLDRALRSVPRSRREAQRACRLCDHTVCRGQACPIGVSADGS